MLGDLLISQGELGAEAAGRCTSEKKLLGVTNDIEKREYLSGIDSNSRKV